MRVLRAIFAGASIGAVLAWIIGSIAFSGPSWLFLFIAALIGATVAAGWLRGEPPL